MSTNSKQSEAGRFERGGTLRADGCTTNSQQSKAFACRLNALIGGETQVVTGFGHVFRHTASGAIALA